MVKFVGIEGRSIGTEDAQGSKEDRPLLGVMKLSAASEGRLVRVVLLLNRGCSAGGEGVAVGAEDCDASEATGEVLEAGTRLMLEDRGPTKLLGGGGSGLLCSRKAREGVSGLRFPAETDVVFPKLPRRSWDGAERSLGLCIVPLLRFVCSVEGGGRRDEILCDDLRVGRRDDRGMPLCLMD